MALNPQITNMAIMLFFFQASKKIPLDDPMVLNGARAAYILSNVIIFALYYYIQTRIDKEKNLKVLKYVEPAPMGSQDEPKLVTTTIHGYDSAEVKKAVKGVLFGVAVMGFMHLYLKYTNPLLVQSILPLKGVLEGNLAKIHVFGKPAKGDLERPWKAAGGLMAAMSGQGAGEVKTDKASIEAAERAGRGGVKEE